MVIKWRQSRHSHHKSNGRQNLWRFFDKKGIGGYTEGVDLFLFSLVMSMSQPGSGPAQGPLMPQRSFATPQEIKDFVADGSMTADQKAAELAPVLQMDAQGLRILLESTMTAADKANLFEARLKTLSATTADSAELAKVRNINEDLTKEKEALTKEIAALKTNDLSKSPEYQALQAKVVALQKENTEISIEAITTFQSPKKILVNKRKLYRQKRNRQDGNFGKNIRDALGFGFFERVGSETKIPKVIQKFRELDDKITKNPKASLADKTFHKLLVEDMKLRGSFHKTHPDVGQILKDLDKKDAPVISINPSTNQYSQAA